MSAPPTPSSRTCWVCFATEEDEAGKEWTSPCLCKGATKWVHQVCLQHWIDEKQRGASSVDVECPQCKFMYHIQYPSASIVLLVYEYANHTVTLSSPMLLAGVTATSLYWVSFTYGVTAASAALGKERSIQFFSNPDSSLGIVMLPLLPWVILGVKVLRLEVQALRLWYRFICPAVYAFLRVFPVTRKFAVASDPPPRTFNPIPVAAVPFISRCVMGTFFLPIISSLVGWLLSNVMSTTQLRRTLLVSRSRAL